MNAVRPIRGFVGPVFDGLEPRLLMSGDAVLDVEGLTFSMGGEWAVEALGADISIVADRYGHPAEALAEMFRADASLRVDQAGSLYYADPLPSVNVALGEADSSGAPQDADSDAPFPLDQTFALHSRPGATKVIYLDFDGHVTPAGTAWNSGLEIDSTPFDRDGDPETFSPGERATIQDIWQRVVEDYAPFDVDVTTEDPGPDALTRSSWDDETYGMRCVISPTSDWYPEAGGVAYVSTFDSLSDTTKPAFVFSDRLSTDKYIADAATHEVGHTLGLEHDGLNDGTEYYRGHGQGTTGWSSIMGLGYYQNVAQWSKGEYFNANNTQDDLAIITTQNGFDYRPDDHGDTQIDATALDMTDQSGVIDAGVIERTDDVDMFSFVTEGGLVSLNVNPLAHGANLDVLAVLYDSAGTEIVTSNPANDLSAEITVSLAPGTYYLSVAGTGTGDPLSDPPTGYTEYGSLGQYWISGTDENEAPTDIVLSQEAIAENSPGGSVVATVGGEDPEGDALTFALTDDADGRITLVDNVLALADDFVPDHEETPELLVTLEASDGVRTYSEQFTITVIDVNEAPTALTLTNTVIAENFPHLALVGTVEWSDPEDDVLVLTLTDDAGGRFALADDTLVVADHTLLDHQAGPTHTVTIEATDGEFTIVETFTITVQAESATPGGADLMPVTDSGLWDDDNLTNFNNTASDRVMVFTVGGTVAGATVTIYANGLAIGSAQALGSETIVVTDQVHGLIDGYYDVTARQREVGKGQSLDSESMTVAVDTTAPTVTTLGLSSTAATWAHETLNAMSWIIGRDGMTAPWSTVDQLVVDFGESILVASAGDLTLTGQGGDVLIAWALTGVGGRKLTWTLTAAGEFLPAGSYTMTFGDGLTDVAGNAGAEMWAITLNILPGDVNGDGQVSSRDRRDLRDAFGSSVGDATYNLSADLNGDGKISSRDRRILRDNYGLSLPAPIVQSTAPAPLARAIPDEAAGWHLQAEARRDVACGWTVTTPRPEMHSAPLPLIHPQATPQKAPLEGATPLPEGAAPLLEGVTPQPSDSYLSVARAVPATINVDVPPAAQLEPDLASGLADPLGL